MDLEEITPHSKRSHRTSTSISFLNFQLCKRGYIRRTKAPSLSLLLKTICSDGEAIALKNTSRGGPDGQN